MRVRLSDLAPGVNYSIQLRSNTGDAVSEWSRVFNIVTSTDTVAPLTPTGITATMDGTSFNLFWSKVVTSADGTPASDLDHYEVQVSSSGTGVTGVYAVTDVKFQFTLDMNRTLFGSPRGNIIMQVRAVDKVGNASAYSATFSQTNPAPANPTGFTGTAITDGFNLKWTGTADTDLLGYRVYSGTTAGSQTTVEWNGIATSVTLQSTAYAADKYFRVVAVDIFGTESPSGPVVGPLRPNSPFTVDSTAPSAVTGLAATLTNATDGKTATAAVSWTAVADTDGDLSEYIVGYKPSSASDWQYTKVDYTNTSTTITGLLPYTNYDFRVRASDFSANLSAWSSTVTKTATANAAPAVPTGLAVVGGRDDLKITWNANTEPDMAYGAGVYDVTVSTSSTFASGNLQYRTGADNIVVNGLASGTTYYVRVRATDSGGVSSAYSATVSASTGAPISAFNYTTSATAPTSPNVGDIWMDTTSGFEKQWSGSAWNTTGNVSLAYTTAKGTDLVANGNGLLASNYNFPAFNYDGTDAPTGANGSFVIKTTANQAATISELIPFDSTKQYKFSFQARQTVAGQTNTMYGFIAPFDAFNNQISPQMYMYVAGTTTTLAAPLNPGDTTVTLTSSANWWGTASKPAGNIYYNRGFIFWDYVDNNGKQWPTGSYSRNVYLGTISSSPTGGMYSDGGITGNVITLNNPWSGPAKPAGTSLSASSAGGTYLYMPSATNVTVPQTWTQYGDVYNAGIMSPSSQAVAQGGAATWALGLPPGTAKISVGWLLNYPAGGTGKHAIAAVSFSDASAAQSRADDAYATATSKNKIIRSTSAASGTAGYVAGDLWWQIDGSGNAIGQWKFSGTAWIAEQLASQVIANLDVNKLTAGSGFITTLNIASGGAIQSAGYTSGGTSGFQLSTAGLTIKGTGNVVDAGVLKGGIITGTTINVGAGGALNVDSTGVIKSNNYAANSTGYQLSNTGLEVNDGSIDAKVLKTNSAVIGDLVIGRSADALGTIRSFDYVAGSAGWKIGKGLFEINSGLIKAGAVQIQTSNNMMPAEYSDFEMGDYYYVNSFWAARGQGKLAMQAGSLAQGVVGGASDPAYKGKQYLGVSTFGGNGAITFQLTDTTDNYNIKVDPSTSYIFSGYFRNNSTTAATYTFFVKGNNGATLATVSVPLAGKVGTPPWTRYEGTVTIPASGVTSVLLGVTDTTATIPHDVHLDAFQFEPKGILTAASVWNPPAVTTINPSGITTGLLRSTSDVSVNGTNFPAWSINTAGNAQFGDAMVRGKMLVGVGGDPDAANSYIASGNFVAGSVGWKFDSSGNLEANSGTFRGALSGATGTFTGTLSGGSVSGGSAQFPASGTGVPGVVQMDSNGFQIMNDLTTNLCTNPSLESLTGVAASSGTTAVLGGAASTDYVANVDIVPFLGQYSLKVYNTTTSGYVDINAGACQPSTTYTVSWYSATTNINDTAPAANAYGNYATMGVIRSDTSAQIATGRSGYVIVGGGAFQGYQYGALSTGIDTIAFQGWQMRSWLTFTTPSNLPANTVLKLRLPAPRTSANGNETTLAVVYDGIQMEAKSYMTRYTDGDQPGCSWTGTRNASTSTRGSQKSFWVPTFDEPVFNGKINSAIVQTSKIKLGSGAAHGSNYIERYNQAQQSFNSGVWTDIPWESNAGSLDRTAADDGPITSGFTTFIGNVAGMYSVYAAYGWSNNANGGRGLRIMVQSPTGTDYVQAQNGPWNMSTFTSTVHLLTVSTTVFLPVGWKVRVQAYQSAGGVLTGLTHTSSTPCKFAMALVT